MDFIFQGFQSSFPVWIYILTFACTLLLAWWSYQIKGITPGYRYLLITLRGTTFFILILLLVNPFLKSETTYYEPPEILVMLDNSESTQISKQQYQGVDSYVKTLEQLNFSDFSDVNFQFFSFADSIRPSHYDSLTFDGEQTNLSTVAETIGANSDDAVAAILLSDGIYTSGKNPVFASANLNIPVFAIGLGDTTFQEDLLVSSVTTNSTGYLNSTQKVEATIQSNGFQGTSFPVELRKGEEVISSETITPESSKSTTEVEFELSLENEGLQQFEITIPARQEEWTDANNRHLFSVDVQDARQKIVSLAFEVHPDVRFIRSLLLEDENIQLTNRTWIREDQFIEGSLITDPDSVDLAIIHGYPSSGLSDNITEELESLIDKVPVLVMTTPQLDPREFEQQIRSLPITISGDWDYQTVSLQMEAEHASHPIMELPSVTYSRLPSLVAPIDNLEPSSTASTLFSSTFQGDSTGKPVIAMQELGNRRIGVASAFNWYQMNQHSNPEVREFVQQLWVNIVSWTSTNPENRLLDIHPRKTSFSGSEKVIINAYLKNERGEDESDGEIDVTLSSDSLEERTFAMENVGNGAYRLDLGPLPEDIYTFEAMAQKEGRELDQQNGEFSVARSNIELLDINRNERLLRQVAESSGGSYLSFDSVDGFWNHLDERSLLDQQEQVQTNFFYPYQQLWWFIVVLVLLCGEWILRKYLSLP